MDALLSALIAAMLAEQGDASQLLAATVAASFGTRLRILAAVALAVALNAALAAAAGAAVRPFMPYRATGLLTALALLSAGGGALLAAKPAKVVLYARLGAPLAVMVAMAVQLFADRTQFLTFALASRMESPALAAVGATLGTLAGMAPALALGAGFARWPVGPVRRAAAVLLLLAGGGMALAALRLV